MQNNGENQSFGGQDHVLLTSNTEMRSVLEEELSWARLERQHVLALSAEADEAIWNLAALARRTMQERDEARNQARMLLADLQARDAQVMMMLPGTPYTQALAPAAAAFRRLVASSSGFGHMSLASSLDAYAVQPSLHGFASSSQDHFDPDMFLVDVAESPQHVALGTAGSSKGESSGMYGQVAERMPLQRRGKSAQAAVLRGTAGHGRAS